MLESAKAVHSRLTREAGDRLAQRLQQAASLGASAAILKDHQYTLERINEMTEAQLLERAVDPGKVEAAEETGVEQRLHRALKAAWKYVDTPTTARSAKNELQQYVEVDNVAGLRIGMLFALQTAWTFVHDCGDDALLDELRQLLHLRHRLAWSAHAVAA